MRKMSQDGGDNTSITSGIENEMKKSGPSILKSTKNSIKRKVQNFSAESDDTANEPLLHKSKEKSEIEKQSAKFLLSKTDFGITKDNDKDSLLADKKIARASKTHVTGITDVFIGNGVKDLKQDISQPVSAASINNHMNTNVFTSREELKNTMIAKTQILVEVDTSKPSEYSPSSLIFTTAKIHADGKMQQMQPLQVTPVPIISTIESGIVKTGKNVTEFSPVNSPMSRKTSASSVAKKDDICLSPNDNVAFNVSIKRFESANDNKAKMNTSSCITAAQSSNINKLASEESSGIKNVQPSVFTEDKIRPKLEETVINTTLQQDCKSNSVFNTAANDVSKANYSSSSFDKSYADINKNVQSDPNPNTGRKTEINKIERKGFYSQPSNTTSSVKGSNSSYTSKEDKTNLAVTTNIKDSKLSNSPDIKMTMSKELTSNIVKLTSSAEPLAGSQRKENSLDLTVSSVVDLGISSEKSITSAPSSTAVQTNVKGGAASNYTTSTIANSQIYFNTTSQKHDISNSQSKQNTNKPGEHKSPGKESMEITNTSDKTELNETISDCDRNMLKSAENSSRLLTKSVLGDIKSGVLDKETLPFTAGTSNVTRLPSASSSTKVTAKLSPPISDKTSITNNILVAVTTKSKIVAAIAPNNKTLTSSSVIMPSTTGNLASSTAFTLTSVDKTVFKPKSNNAVTVVSSISKSTTTPSTTKSSSQGSNSTIMTKSTPATKQLTSPSTVKTISSVPTAKSSVISSITHDKISAKEVTTQGNKPLSPISNKTTSVNTATKKSIAPKTTSTVVTLGAKVAGTSSLKSAAKSSTQCEVKSSNDTKGNKSSKA